MGVRVKVEMVLVGRVNKQIVNGLNQLGTRAVGLSGSDGSLVEARPWGNGSHGLVGDVARVNPDVLEPLLEKGDYQGVLEMLAELREPVDAFFDTVMVMADDEAVRNNRLALLAFLRDLFLNVADISLLQE